MTTTQWIGLAILLALFVFAVFAFRKGQKVTPETGKDPFGGLPPGGEGPPPGPP
jgi:hypothetical protein